MEKPAPSSEKKIPHQKPAYQAAAAMGMIMRALRWTGEPIFKSRISTNKTKASDATRTATFETGFRTPLLPLEAIGWMESDTNFRTMGSAARRDLTRPVWTTFFMSLPLPTDRGFPWRGDNGRTFISPPSLDQLTSNFINGCTII